MQNHSCWVLALAKTPNVKFSVGNTNMLVSKNAIICVTPNANAKIWLPQTRTPNASQWNIGDVGSSGVGHTLAMYISYCLCQFHLRWVPNANAFSVEYGLKVNRMENINPYNSF